MLAALFLGAFALSHACACGPEQEPPPPPQIGEGDPIGPPDAGDIYEADAGPVVCEEDEHEENDARGDAVVVESGDTVSATGCGDDDDWFAVTSAPGCSVLAQLEKVGAGVGDVDMLMFDPDGQLVGSSTSPGADEAINAPASKDGPYAVRIRPGSRDNVPYTLSLSSTCPSDLTCPADDPLEPNDASTEPAALSEGVAHDGILCSGDEDWFAAPATLGCLADARLDFVDGSGDVDLQLFLADGVTRVANSNGVDDDEQVLKGITQPGMRFRVFFFTDEPARPYRFTVSEICAGQLACPTDDPFEPNDNLDQTSTLFAGLDEVIGTICASEDFFELVPQANCTLSVRMNFVHAQGDLDMELVNANSGAVQASSASTTDVEQIDFVPPNTSALAVRVRGFQGATNSYRLRVETLCP